MQKVTPVNHSYTDWYLIHISRATEFLEMLNTFPAKLHKILSSPSNEDIIAWSPHGRSFKVLNAVCFMKEVVPEHFSFTKMESFHRDLTGWGFKRLYQPGPDHHSYYHEKFLKGMPQLVLKMTRMGDGKGKTTPNKKGHHRYSVLLPRS